MFIDERFHEVLVFIRLTWIDQFQTFWVPLLDKKMINILICIFIILYLFQCFHRLCTFGFIYFWLFYVFLFYILHLIYQIYQNANFINQPQRIQESKKYDTIICIFFIFHPIVKTLKYFSNIIHLHNPDVRNSFKFSIVRNPNFRKIIKKEN